MAKKQLEVPQKAKWGAKEFPFRRFLTCHSCGSQIVGEEKFKKRVDGGKIRHVYYHCSRQVDYNCPEPYVKEERLIETLLRKVDRLELDSENVEPGLANAINKFTAIVRTKDTSFENSQAFLAYARYVLETGTEFERTRLIRNISTKLAIHNRSVVEVGDGSI